MDVGRKAINLLKSDIQRLGVEIDLITWDRITQRCRCVQVKAGDKIHNQARVADTWVFLSEGVAASEQTDPDGVSTVARFFEPGDVCANLTSVWTREIGADDLVALTDVIGVAIPDDFFRREYLEGGSFGIYLRLKMMSAHLFAKELVCAKTSGRTETRYRFLERYHKAVIGTVKQKEIARFLGMTPQGLSRFLRHRKTKDS